VTWFRLVLAAWLLLADSVAAYAAAANRDLERIPFNVGFLVVVGMILVAIGNRPMLMASNRRLRAVRRYLPSRSRKTVAESRFQEFIETTHSPTI
jgi:hypothetical protein